MSTSNDQERVLAICAHPDDETLGCGGTLLHHASRGAELFWIRATSPHEPQWSRETIESKDREVEAVADAYGMQECFHLGFPAAHLDEVPQNDLIQAVDEVVREVRPVTIYLIHAGDVHSDHRVLFEAAASVLKPFRMPELGVRRVLSYETLSSTEAAAPGASAPFVPNVHVDITPWIDRKIEIMALYASEVHEDPLPRGPESIRALARWRGSAIGRPYAEAFQLVREIL